MSLVSQLHVTDVILHLQNSIKLLPCLCKYSLVTAYSTPNPMRVAPVSDDKKKKKTRGSPNHGHQVHTLNHSFSSVRSRLLVFFSFILSGRGALIHKNAHTNTHTHLSKLTDTLNFLFSSMWPAPEPEDDEVEILLNPSRSIFGLLLYCGGTGWAIPGGGGITTAIAPAAIGGPPGGPPGGGGNGAAWCNGGGVKGRWLCGL